MKEIVSYQQKDSEMLEDLKKVIADLESVTNKYEARFQEVSQCWSKNRAQLLSELDNTVFDEGGCSEFDYTDKFYAALWNIRDFLRGKAAIMQRVFESEQPNIGDVKTLQTRNLERIKANKH